MTITQDELQALRDRGEDDATILTKYRKFAPDLDSDIGTLLDRGEKPGVVLDKLTKFHAQGGTQETDPTADRGMLQNTWDAAKFGVSNTARGFERTAARANMPTVAGALKTVADASAPADYNPAGSRFDITDPSTYWKYGLRAIGEALPGVGTDVGAGAVLGGTIGALAGPVGAAGGAAVGAGVGRAVSNFGRSYGPNMDARLAYEGKPKDAEPTFGDKLFVGGTTAAEAGLNAIGLGGVGERLVGKLIPSALSKYAPNVAAGISGGATGSVAKGAGAGVLAQVPGQIAGAGIRDAAAAVPSDVLNQVGRTAGTDPGLDISGHEIANSAALAGATGATIRTARAAGDVRHAASTKDVDAEAASRYADRIAATEVNPNTAKRAYEAVDKADSRLKSDIQVYDGDGLKPLVKDNEAFAKVQGVLKDLQGNKVVTKDDLAAVKAHLDATEEGQTLYKLLSERQEGNRLKERGVFQKGGDDPKGYFAGGISSNPLVRAFVNPIGPIRSSVGRMALGAATGTGAAAGAVGLPIMSQLAAHGAGLAYLAGGQIGTYGAIRGIDAALGIRNPAKEFTNRFGGLPQGDGPTAPSWRDQQAQAQAAQQQARGDAQAKSVAQGLAKSALQRTISQGKLEGRQQNARDAEADKITKNLAQQALRTQVVQGSAEAKAQAQAEALRAKQEESGWKQNDQAKQAELKRQAEIERAYAQTDPRLPKQADPEALWAQHEASQINTPDPDLEAQAGIQQGYKYLAQQALQAQQARDAQSNKAWKQKSQQDIQAEKVAGARGVEFNKAQAQVNKPTPEMIKASQEDAAWRSQEGKPQGEDWSDQDAMAAIQRELASREKASKAILKLTQPSGKPVQGRTAPKGSNGSQKAQTAAGSASEPLTDTTRPNTFTVTHMGQTVERPLDTVHTSLAGAKTQILTRMKQRQAFADDLEKAVGRAHSAAVNEILTHLNQNARSWKDAQGHISEVLNDLPPEAMSKGWDVVGEHEAALAGTYGTRN